jgi:hypothetical protein
VQIDPDLLLQDPPIVPTRRTAARGGRGGRGGRGRDRARGGGRDLSQFEHLEVAIATPPARVEPIPVTTHEGARPIRRRATRTGIQGAARRRGRVGTDIGRSTATPSPELMCQLARAALRMALVGDGGLEAEASGGGLEAEAGDGGLGAEVGDVANEGDIEVIDLTGE